MTKIWDRIQNEPVLVLNLVNAIIALVVVFGVLLTMPQQVAIIGISTAVLNIIARSKVSPVRKKGD